jgi:hypothetical protein
MPKLSTRDEDESEPADNEPSRPRPLADILVFPNGPKESHISRWLKIGDDALTDRHTA